MNMLNGLLRRLLPHRSGTRNEYAFELLRSTSARELKKNARRTQLPRFYSQHEAMPSLAPPQTNSDDVIEVIGEGSQAMPGDQSALLGFINAAGDSYDSPTCSSYGSEFPAEDSSLDVAISQTQLIRSHPLFMEGVLLKCVDAKPLFPYMHYAIFKGSDHDMRIANIDEVIKEMNLRPKCQFGAYDEVYSIQKTTPTPDARLPSHRHAGYIVISFKILEDETQQDSLEKSWLSWSGAREIYKYSPRTWNLRRISLHKFPKRRRSGACHSFAYVMMCEFGSILHPSNRLQALDMCERLRVRNCGYWSYSSAATPPEAPTSSVRNPMLRGLSQEVGTTTESNRRRAPKSRLRDRPAGYGLEDKISPIFHSYHHFTDLG